jgi:hypothetical protein
MFVRWQTYKSVDRIDHCRERKDARSRIKAILVESVRVGGKPRQRHIAFIASYQLDPPDYRDASNRNRDALIWFWLVVMGRLDKLRNRITADDRKKILADIAKKIGKPPTPAQLKAYDKRRVAFWKSFIGHVPNLSVKIRERVQ